VSQESPPYRIDATGACPFCGVDGGRTAWSSPLAVALWDVYPVSLGHALVMPRRHVASWSELTTDEKTALTAGVDAARTLIDER
jgi:diadenosine tetraphosphate (Ap4A) HIT family hydrolase